MLLYAVIETGIQLSVGRERSQRNEFELPLFEIAIIEAATRNFSMCNKIGEGGFGPVYKVNYYFSVVEYKENDISYNAS